MSTPLERALRLANKSWSVNFSWSPEQAALSVEDNASNLTVFSSSACRPLELFRVSTANLEQTCVNIDRHADLPLDLDTDDHPIHLYVCTHRSRDCRCGNIGSQVVELLRAEVQGRMNDDPLNPVKRIIIAETGHIGLHKYAANLLVFPFGDWLGLLTPELVPEVLDKILIKASQPFTLTDPPLIPTHWRGRMGLPKETQIHLAAIQSKLTDVKRPFA